MPGLVKETDCAAAGSRPRFSRRSTLPSCPNPGIKPPQQGTSRCVERKNFLCGRDSIENAIHDDRTGLQYAFLFRVVAPGNCKQLHVAAINPGERRVVIVFRRAAVCRPVVLLLAARRGGVEGTAYGEQ